MATTNTTLMDTRYKTIVRSVISGTNTDTVILDASGLVGYQSGMTPVLNISKIFWSTTGGNVTISNLGTGKHTAIELVATGAGQYGYQPGQPALPNATTGGATQGDVGFTNSSAATGTLVIEYHKIPDSNGRGWGG
ncbi:MAG: hypothetical protein VX237_01685 [Chloroflexota bacterium]|nr:hypothetical protein [Chloroflexota bacterium]